MGKVKIEIDVLCALRVALEILTMLLMSSGEPAM